MVKAAVILSGCGYLDGTEVREACYTLLALDEADVEFQCFAPDQEQMHVVDHRSGKPTDEKRNVLTESARIARGAIEPLDEFEAKDFDFLVFPGGFGAAKNLSNFATEGAGATVDPGVRAVVEAMADMEKPIGFICIAPAAIGALVLGDKGPMLTIGDDPDTAQAIQSAGAVHVRADTDKAVVDEIHRVVSTPAYMDDDARPSAVYAGITDLVGHLVRLSSTPVAKAI